MAGRRRAHAKNYSSDSILFRNIFGMLIMGIGALAGISALGLLEGSVFMSIRRIIQGLGGALCLVVPIFIVWGGLLVLLSAYRRISMRAFVLLLLFYLFLLSIINITSITSKTPPQTLMEYYASKAGDQYFTVLSASYTLESYQGSFGGMLGMLAGWPLHTFIGSIGSVILLSVLCLLCLLFFSKFDFVGSLRQLRVRSKSNRDQKTLEKRKQAHMREAGTPKAGGREAPAGSCCSHLCPSGSTAVLRTHAKGTSAAAAANAEAANHAAASPAG